MPYFTITLPATSLKPYSSAGALRAAAGAGFDGIEVLLAPGTRHWNIRTLASDLGLSLYWHEIWSGADDPALLTRLMTLAGMLPKGRHPLAEQLPSEMHEAVVCYPHRINEICSLEISRNVRLQTARPIWDNMPWKQFVACVHESNYRVTFDTQHVLEWYFNVRGVAALGIYRRDTLQYALLDCWDAVSTYVDEVHFNNFDPAGGDMFGRNMFPTEGVLDLAAFATRVKDCDKPLIITPEVGPAHLFAVPLPHFTQLPIALPIAPRLRRLREVVADMFA